MKGTITFDKAARDAALKLSQLRQEALELSGVEERSEEQGARLKALEREIPAAEESHRAALLAAPDAQTEYREGEPDPEMRERIELRSRASLAAFFRAAARGALVSGAEAELCAAAGVNDGGIPLELWDTPTERRAVTEAPSTVGVNLDRIRPAVFASAILPRLGVEMPSVASGTYASATITTSQTAAAKTKGDAAAATAGAFTVTTATPKRISARLELQLEDIAAVGQANFESALRENLSLVLSDALDDAGLNGDGTAPNLAGLFHRLTTPTDPTGAATNFDGFAAVHAAGVDGLWANTLKDVAIVVGPATYVLASTAFQNATNYKGELSAAAYAMANTGGFWTNKRMPGAASSVQQAILYRMGRMGMRTAVCPHWNTLSIDDIYTGAASAQRSFTMHVLLGDVILVQPDAYAQVAYKVT